MTKIVINTRPGGFNLPDKFLEMYLKRTDNYQGISEKGYLLDRQGDAYVMYMIERSHPVLCDIVNAHKDELETPTCKLVVVDVPDDVDWYIDQNSYGQEWVAETHRVWHGY